MQQSEADTVMDELATRVWEEFGNSEVLVNVGLAGTGRGNGGAWKNAV